MQVIEFKAPSDRLLLSPIGDIQYGSPGCDTDKLERHIQHGIKNDWHFIGMGDYTDPGSPSERKLLTQVSASLHDSTSKLIEDAMQGKIAELAGILDAPGRWIGVVEGDHRFDFADGQPSDALLARKLKTEFLGTSAYVLIRFPGVKRPYTIFVFHGKRGGSTTAVGQHVDFARQMQGHTADLYLMGHLHQLNTIKHDRLRPYVYRGKPGLLEETVFNVSTGSFLNGWVYGVRGASGYPRGGYVEQAGLRSNPTGAPLLEITPAVKCGQEVFEVIGSVR